jgi:hypothetical protein
MDVPFIDGEIMEEQGSPNLPNPLTKNQVDAVRFQITKPGYAFEQVESFIEKTRQTLEFLEKEMKKDKLALAEAQDEIELLTERTQTLSATLEIFKVKGDAVVAEDGDYLTENKVNQQKKIAEENAYLKEQLIAAQNDANAGWEAEAELRKYIEVQLLPWLNKNKEAIVQNSTNVDSAIDEGEDSIPLLSEEDLSPNDILYEEELSHEPHIKESNNPKPLLSSDNESDWFN